MFGSVFRITGVKGAYECVPIDDYDSVQFVFGCERSFDARLLFLRSIDRCVVVSLLVLSGIVIYEPAVCDKRTLDTVLNTQTWLFEQVIVVYERVFAVDEREGQHHGACRHLDARKARGRLHNLSCSKVCANGHQMPLSLDYVTGYRLSIADDRTLHHS